MRNLNSKVRVSGLSDNKRHWVRFTFYKDNVYYSLERMPVDFKKITGEEFAALTFQLQRDLDNIKWELSR